MSCFFLTGKFLTSFFLLLVILKFNSTCVDVETIILFLDVLSKGFDPKQLCFIHVCLCLRSVEIYFILNSPDSGNNYSSIDIHIYCMHSFVFVKE